MAELLRITPQDNVAVALTALSSRGQTVTVMHCAHHGHGLSRRA